MSKFSQKDLYKQLVNALGGPKKTEEKLEVSQATVSGWVTGAHGMSAKKALKASHVTLGEFKAEELCRDLAVE